MQNDALWHAEKKRQGFAVGSTKKPKTGERTHWLLLVWHGNKTPVNVQFVCQAWRGEIVWLFFCSVFILLPRHHERMSMLMAAGTHRTYRH